MIAPVPVHRFSITFKMKTVLEIRKKDSKEDRECHSHNKITQPIEHINGRGRVYRNNQRTNGPVNAHLISWPSKAQNIQNLENICQRNDIDLQNSHTFTISISNLHLPTFRSQAAIVSKKSTVFTFSHRKA